MKAAPSAAKAASEGHIRGKRKDETQGQNGINQSA
jgi:hypothetical protein